MALVRSWPSWSVEWCDTNAPAGMYNLEYYGTQSPFFLMSLMTQAHLLLPNGIVTGKYPMVQVKLA